MLNGRLYRATFIPVLIALAIAAFSLTARPLPLVSTLAPDAFIGARAAASMKSLAAEFPDRTPGSAGDEALAARIARSLEGLGGPTGGGFSVRTRHFDARTAEGRRSLTTVIAQRPGSTDATPVVILAHRDAAVSYSSQAARGAREGRAEETAVALERQHSEFPECLTDLYLRLPEFL